MGNVVLILKFKEIIALLTLVGQFYLNRIYFLYTELSIIEAKTQCEMVQLPETDEDDMPVEEEELCLEPAVSPITDPTAQKKHEKKDTHSGSKLPRRKRRN